MMKNLKDIRLFAFMAILWVAASLSAQAQTEVPKRYVSVTNGDYTNDGRSWAGAKKNLQDAIEDLKTYMATNRLKEGHVYVSAGTYTPTTATPGGDGTLYTSFIIYEGIKVFGGFDADNPEATPDDRKVKGGTTVGQAKGMRWQLENTTTLSGNHTSTPTDPLTWDEKRNEYSEAYTGNSYHVVWFASKGLDARKRAIGLDETTVLDGFTIRDGYAMNRGTISSTNGSHAFHNSYGAGVYMVANSEVRNCIITQNASSLRGGGVYMDGGGLLEQCYVTRNQSAGVGVTDGYGGGVAMDDGGMVRHCVIENNVSRVGAGLSLTYTYATAEDAPQRYTAAAVGCVINNNTSTAEAGGVYLRNGGVLNHVTIARNRCVGASVEYNGRKYARSGGLYVDGGAFVVNSVIWGNEVGDNSNSNNNVQYATFRETTSSPKATLEYVALSRSSYSDWSGTVKLTNGVYNLSEDNTNKNVADAHPEFVNPTGKAGVLATNVESDWTPRYFSYLRHKGVQVDNNPEGKFFYHTAITKDFVGDEFAPRCAIGALVAYSMEGANAMADDMEGGTTKVRTVFVDPELVNNVSMDPNDKTGIGASWERPFHNINDAIRYISNLKGADTLTATNPVQIVVKAGTCTTAGNAYLRHLRSSTLTIPSHVHMYGGFDTGLTGTNIPKSSRNPKATPTRITANIVGDDYGNNGTHIIVLGHGTSNAIIDGFQLYYGNAQTNSVVTELGLHGGAGIVVVNSPFYPQNPTNPTPEMTGNIIRNCVVANCTATQGAAVYMGNSSGRRMELKMENCIFHNNSVLSADSAIVTAAGNLVDLKMDHCLIRGNVGYAVMAKNNAAITVTNTAVHANIVYDANRKGNLKVSDLKYDEDNKKADDRVRTFRVLGGTITGSHNMMDMGVTDPTATAVAQARLRYHTIYVNANPDFVNPTSNIGVNTDGDVTSYGGAPNWMPTNTNPLVNAADDGIADLNQAGTDLTCSTPRNYGGASDIGALENTYQPKYRTVIYVRDYGNTTEPGGDGSSWVNAINGNSLHTKYQNNHGFAGVDAELYPENEQLTGLQWAVDEAFYRSLEKDAKDNIIYRTVTGVTCFKPRNESTPDENKTSIDTSAVILSKRVEVWVAEGEYLRRDGFFMRNSVDVLGGFPDEGNPGKKERAPKTYETIIETNRDNEVTTEDVTGSGQWGPQVDDFNKGITVTTGANTWKISDFGSCESSYPAENCIDGSTDTYWESRSSRWSGTGTRNLWPQWVIIDMGKVGTIRSLKITNNNYYPTSYTLGYATNNPDSKQDNSVTESNFTTVNKTVTAQGEQIINFDSDITCRYLYVKVTKCQQRSNGRNIEHVDIKEIQAFRNANADGKIDHFPEVYSGYSGFPDDVYDLNAYTNAYKSKRVLTQPYPYFKGTTQINGRTSGTNLEFDNKTFNPFCAETTWDGFIIQNGRVKITHQRDGGAGVALRENGRLANCVIRRNVIKTSKNIRGAGIFQNGGIIENCVIEDNIVVSTGGGSIFGCGLYQRTGTVFNTSISKNTMKGDEGDQKGTAVYFENGRFYNNTITGNDGHFPIYSGSWFSEGRIDIYNTIICNNVTDDLEFDCTIGDPGSFSVAKNITLKNCLFESSKHHKVFTSSYVNVDAASFKYLDYLDDESMPKQSYKDLFEDADNGDFRLVSGARAINAGTAKLGKDITDTKDIELPDVDAGYTDRVKDCVVDIGAYEYDGSRTITPDEKSEPGFAVYYVIPHGAGNASADSPANAACWMKLQKILDAAGRYTYENRNNPDRKIALIKLAGDSKIDRVINDRTVNTYEGFTYRPRRSCKQLSPGEEENERDYSLIVPHGVQMWGGYSEDFKTRNVLEYRTALSGIFKHGDVDVQAYNVVTFTNDIYDPEADTVTTANALKDIDERAVLDGLFIEKGKADGELAFGTELAKTRVGGAAVVTGYAHIRNCIVQDNTSAQAGGGLYLLPGALVSGSIIQYNTTEGNGGGVYVEEPKESSASTFASIISSDIIYNTAAQAGGGLWFETNVRANSSLFWRNTSSEMANISGQTMPTDVATEPGIRDYPISFCATETTREPGIDNIIVHTDPNKGVRFKAETYDHNYTDKNGNVVDNVMHGNGFEFYKLSEYSLIVRSGMQYAEYDARVGTKDGLLKADMMGVDRTGYGNEFIDIGARAHDGPVLPDPTKQKLMNRIFVGRNEDEVNMDAVNVMREQGGYYGQEGSSFAYPMRYLGDALEYIRAIRKTTDLNGEYKYKDEKFEIILCGGTYLPRRNIKGEYVNGRGCTFLVPENVTIVGGVRVQNGDNSFFGSDYDDEHGGKAESTYSKTGLADVTIRHASLEDIIGSRELHDINHNNIAEPWEMKEQTILSGQVVNAASSHNVFHIMTCVADEYLVGGLPTPSYTYADDAERSIVAGEGVRPKYRGRPIVLDGLNIEDGMALTHESKAVKSDYTYFKGGAISVEGNWTTGTSIDDPDFKNHRPNESEQQFSPVGYRNIPLEVRNSIFMNNGAGRGGAIFTDGELKVFACNFAQNYARVGTETFPDKDGKDVTVSYAGRGGAINASYETILINSIFANNEADTTGIASDYEGVGGAVLLGNYARLHVLNCDFVRNLAAGYPAIYCYRTNLGVRDKFKGSIAANLDSVRYDNPHKVINSIFWGNKSKSAAMDLVINYAGYDRPDFDKEADHPEALWFCAYERGKGNQPVYSGNNVDYRLQPYDGYILEQDNADELFTGNPTYIPWLWGHEYKVLDSDNTTVVDAGETNPDAEAGLVSVTNNILINSDNDAIDGPNFISPSTEPGRNGFYISADWMIGRINNLVDNGWTYLQQDLSKNEPKFIYDGPNQTKVRGSGIYHAASHDFGALSEEATAVAIGDDEYMRYSDERNKPILRVSIDPNPTHHQSFIDLGVYEYQHVKLSPVIETGEVDVLWVTERERTGGAADGVSWATATSDLQRAIETLLASRNGHDKEIRMLEGNYQPVYTITGNLAFTITTDLQTGITLPDNDAHGVRSLTIRGGYSKDLEGQENVDLYPVHLYASERTGGDLNFGHVMVIDDMKQRISQLSGDSRILTDTMDYVVPVTIKGLSFSNVKANNNDGGVALQYKQPRDAEGKPITKTTYWQADPADSDKGDITDAVTDRPLYKLILNQCAFYNNGSPVSIDTPPAVTIDAGAGDALIYNSLFHSNQGNPLTAADTKVVNCTFAMNNHPVQLSGRSELHNSLLWRNHLLDFDDEDYFGPENVPGQPAVKSFNAISTLTRADAYDNVPLDENNSDALLGPNFFDPGKVDDSGSAFMPPAGPSTRDLRVNPSSRVMSKGDTDIYVKLVRDKRGVYPHTGSAVSADLVKMDRDLADVTRLYGRGLERGAYECVAIMNRVLYVNPYYTLPGSGVNWGDPYGNGQLQTAIDAAAVYYDIYHDPDPDKREEERAYVFVKGYTEPAAESITMREGVSVYGSIDVSCNIGVEREDDDTYQDAKIRKFIDQDLPAYRSGLAMNATTLVSDVKAGEGITFCHFDGLQIGAKDGTDPLPTRTRPVVDLGAGSTVALTNSIIANNHMGPGVSLIRNTSGLLYDLLVRDNGTADVSLGTQGHALNCTFAGDAASWTTLKAAPAAQSANNIIYNEGERPMPFAPYFRPSEVAYHAGNVPSKTNRNLWYQLHERSPHIAAGQNGTAGNGKSLLPAALQPYVDFTADRDLLGNPRLLGQTVDLGCYETWSTGHPSADGTVTPEDLSANMSQDSYGGQHYPHQGSVVYLQPGSKLVCELKDAAARTPYFVGEHRLQPGYLLAMDGGSLYGQGNEIRLHYVAAERNLTGRYALMAVPFAVKNDGLHITRTTYEAVGATTGTEVKEEVAPDARYSYDGDMRSRWYYDFSADDSPCWQSLPADGTIAACDGFLMDSDGQPAGPVRLTAYDAMDAPYTEDANAKTVTLTQHDQSDTGKDEFHFTSEYNMGWNLKGMPYLVSGYDPSTVDADGREAMFVPHVLHTMSADGNYHPGYSWQWNNQVTPLSPGHAFFTQTAVIGDGACENISFAVPVLPASASEARAQCLPAVELSAPGYGRDRVILFPSAGDEDQEATRADGSAAGPGLDYRFGTDAVKFAALSDTLPQVAVSGTDGVGLALLSHAPLGEEIPLSVQVKGETAYTFSLPDRDAYAAYADVWLRDHATGEVTNLALDDYTTGISPSDDPARFSLYLGSLPAELHGRHGSALYKVSGIRVKRPHGRGVYIQTGDRVRKIIHSK